MFPSLSFTSQIFTASLTYLNIIHENKSKAGCHKQNNKNDAKCWNCNTSQNSNHKLGKNTGKLSFPKYSLNKLCFFNFLNSVKISQIENYQSGSSKITRVDNVFLKRLHTHTRQNTHPDGPRSHLIWSCCEEVFQLQRCIAGLYYFGQNTKNAQTKQNKKLCANSIFAQGTNVSKHISK